MTSTIGWRIPGPPPGEPDPRVVRERGHQPLGISGLLLWGVVLGVLAAWLLARLWPDAPPWPGKLWTAVSWIALLAAAFGPHLGAICGLAAVTGLALKRWRLALAGLLIAALLIAPAAIAARRAPAEAPLAGAQPTMRIMTVNLGAGLANASGIADQIAGSEADIVLLQELTPDTLAALDEAVGPLYPHRAVLPRHDAFGQGVFSKLSFVDVPKNRPPGGEHAGWGEPQVGVRVKFDGRLVEIWNIHLRPPLSLRQVRRQHDNAAALRDLAVRRGSALILAGDFNAPREAGPVRGLLRAGLSSAHEEAGGGLGVTWPLRLRAAGLGVTLPGVRIDHVLFSPELDCVRAEVGEDFGSDHRPVVAILQWAKTGWPTVAAGQ